ncbi:MAG: hypothetical protein UMS36scaffold28_43 [Phage 59_13]|nr:MAG: hypothetical protein UMS36scaffold28_43 [Phage 59_13]
MSSTVIYKEETQRPYVDGRRVLSVTDVLRISGMYDGYPASDHALWMGQARHKAIELWIKGTLDLDTLHPDILPSVEAYLEFEQQTGFKPLATELECWSPSLQLATRLDLLGVFPDQHEVIVELKSGAVSKVAGLQTAGQDIAKGLPRRKRYGLSVPQSGKPKVIPFTSTDDYGTFISCLTVAHWKIEKLGVKLDA